MNNPGQQPDLPDVTAKRDSSLAKWKDMKPFLETVKDNFLVAGRNVTLERLPGGGRSVNADRGGASAGVNQFDCSVDISSGSATIQYGVISGAGLSSVAPDVSGTAMTGEVTATVGSGGVIGVYFEIEPDTQIVSYDIVDDGSGGVTSTAVYGFGNGGTIVNGPDLKVYASTAAKDADRTTAVVNTSTGSVTTNLEEVIVLAAYSGTDLIQPQNQIGPLGISVCGGNLRWNGPAIFTA
jgi:hypothetical protein